MIIRGIIFAAPGFRYYNINLFIMCLLPLTMILRKCSSGYQLGDKHVLVNPLVYLDDL